MPLQKSGGATYVPNLIARGRVREVGAPMTATIMAGQVSAAFVAQPVSMEAFDGA